MWRDELHGPPRRKKTIGPVIVSATPENERRRVTRHILRGERTASARDVSHLGHVQRLIRQLLLGELVEYVRRARFPKNRSSVMRPTFVDADGTRCAIAHLMELGGAAELVRSIAEGSNFARVVELAGDPRVVAWLDAAGLTVGEAALIQPEYCMIPHSSCVCGQFGSNGRATGVLEGTIVRSGAQSAWVMRVDALYGDPQGHFSGEEVDVTGPNTAAVVALIPLYGGSASPPFFALALNAQGHPEACDYNSKEVPLTKRQTIDALQSSNCNAALAKVDSRWADHPACGGCGCDTQGSGTPSSVGILLAVVGAVAARRLAR